jgi:putative ABC transport system permease protein
VLVTFQFCISVLLIASTLIIIKQMNYVTDKKLGFNKEEILLIPISSSEIYRNRETFKNEILNLRGVENVTAISGEPGGFHDNYSFKIEGKEDGYFRMRTLFTDSDYLKTFNLKLLAGRDFSKEFSTDDHATILNETAVKHLGWKNEEAIGKRLMVNLVDTTYRTIIGVVKDFHFSSLKDKIEPLAISTHTDQRVIAVEINTGNITSTIDEIRKSWQRIIPSYPFEYDFLDQTFAKLYEAEQKQLKVFSFFSLIAILIACLGLFGLTAFTAEQKTKEIGIRKVLGASVSGILLLFSKDFLKLIVIANIIAIPLIYYLMNKWLQDFAYRIEIDSTIFFISAASVFLISIFTIVVQALKAATANPVKSLKYE